MKKMKVAGVRIYETPKSPKGTHAIGLRVASRLNGNNEGLTGTFIEGKEYDGRYVGFITLSEKFQSLTAAETAAAKLASKYPRGKVMDPTQWKWGEEMEDAPEGAHAVVFIDDDGDEEEQDTSAARRGLKAEKPVEEPQG